MCPRPRDLEGWRAFWAGVPRARLFDRARAANTPEYVELLLADGLDAAAVEEIFAAIATRFRDEGLRPPAGSYADLLLLVPAGPSR